MSEIKAIKLFLIFSFVFIFSYYITLNAGVLGNRKIKTVSQQKIADIEKIVIRQFEQNYKSEDYDAIKNSIIDEVNSVFPVKPGSKIKKINFKQIEQECNKKASTKYPLTDEELTKKYQAEAEAKFVSAKVNDEVNVQYKMGFDKIVKVSGVYHGFNRYQNGIIIGRKTVPLFDLLPEDKVKFNEEYRKLTINDFVNSSVKKYLQEKEKYCVKQIQSTIKDIDQENEDAGYISAWREWRTPEEITNMIYKYYLPQYMKKDSNAPTSSDSKAGKTNNTNAQKQQKKQGSNPTEAVNKKTGVLNEVLNAMN